MKLLKNKYLNLIFIVSMCLFFLISGIICPTSVQADTSSNYTSVMDDLTSDTTFNVDNYPLDDEKYELQVIQIAESSNGELFVYVYNPSYRRKPLTATSIRLSTAINDSYYPVDYKMTLLSSENMFQKYVVEDLEVKKDVLRYYVIVCLHRNFDEEIDGASETDNVISEVPCAVEQCWTAITLNGVVSYNYTYHEMIEITDRWDGFLEYDGGYPPFFYESCRSHFIAFNADRRIDKLLEADVSYYYETIEHRVDSPSQQEKTTSSGLIYVDRQTLYHDEYVEGKTIGWISENYTWSRIQSVSTFIKEEDLTDASLENLEGKTWVLRFFETEKIDYYIQTGENTGYSIDRYTNVSEVTVLRLKFETDGKVYNLGVISDRRSSDGIRDNNSKGCLGFNGCLGGLEQIFMILALIFVLWLLNSLGVLPFIGRVLIFIITAPFKLLKWLIDKFRGD